MLLCSNTETRARTSIFELSSRAEAEEEICLARWRGDPEAMRSPPAIPGGIVEAEPCGGRGGWLMPGPAVRLWRTEAGFAGCGGDADSDRPGCGGGVTVFATPAAVVARMGIPATIGMVGADMEPDGGVREPSLGAVDAWDNSRGVRPDDDPRLTGPGGQLAVFQAPGSSRLAPSDSHHGANGSSCEVGGTTRAETQCGARAAMGSALKATGRSRCPSVPLAISAPRSLVVW